jgi:hypothetical protein
MFINTTSIPKLHLMFYLTCLNICYWNMHIDTVKPVLHDLLRDIEMGHTRQVVAKYRLN